MDSGSVILIGMSKYDRIIYIENPETKAPGNIKKKLLLTNANYLYRPWSFNISIGESDLILLILLR